MKKILSLVLVCIMMTSLLAFPACANEIDTYEPPIDIEEYQYFDNCWAGIASNGDGTYDVLGGAGSTRSNLHIYVTVTLQKRAVGSTSGWTEVTHWDGDGAFSASAGATRSIHVAGTYRAVTNASIYDQYNNFLEAVSATSSTVTIR